MSTEDRERQLSGLDLAAVGVNGVIGSGVYLLRAPMALVAGRATLLATVLCGGLCLLVALCFGELSSMFREDGGAFVYARAAFGQPVGFVVGWLAAVENVLSFAAVSAGFASAIAAVIPGLHSSGARTALSIGLILAFGALNFRGVSSGAWGVKTLVFLKVLPLLVLTAFGLRFFNPDLLRHVVQDGHPWTGLGHAIFLATFMLSGFEYASVPAGAARDPQRAIPRALIGSVAAVTGLYLLLEVGVFSALSNVGSIEQPLLALALRAFGPAGATVIGLAGAVSMAGFCAGSALVNPRFIVALSEGGVLPRAFARRTSWGTPGRAIVLNSWVAGTLVLTLNFEALIDVATLLTFAQYLPVALAVPVLRRTRPELERRYQIPGPAWLIPGVVALACILLMVVSHPSWAQWRFTAGLLILGGAVWLVTVFGERRLTRKAPPP